MYDSSIIILKRAAFVLKKNKHLYTAKGFFEKLTISAPSASFII